MKRFVLVGLLVVMSVPVWGWHLEGHHILTLSAVGALPEEVPVFFRNGAPTIAHMSIDPDLAKHKGTPHVRAAEYPEHFLDREMLEVDELPEGRFDFIKLCYEHKVVPEKMGFVPYALGEWTERLAVAFAEHRKWPNNPHIKMKCLIYAGFIAHYAEDMCQPLHVTIHYDGRVVEGSNEKEQKGIHNKVDGLIEYLALKPKNLSKDQKIEPLNNLMAGIMGVLKESFALVDRTYELGPRIPKAEDKDWKADAEVVAFAEDRARQATRFTAQLYLTAWRLSESLAFDDFIKREKWDGK